MTVATMNIKDPEVHRMAHELAAMRHTSATGAVRDALREAIEREREVAQQDFGELVRDIVRRGRLIDEPVLTDDDIYDEHGLPR